MPRFGQWDMDDEDPYLPGGGNPYVPTVGDPSQILPPSSGAEPTDDYGEFSFPSYSGASQPYWNYEAAPEFNAPEFYAPSYEDAQNEPGFQFRLRSGADALERSAAARGVLRTGGTLKGIEEYGQNFGAQEYSNVYDRALRTYGTRLDALKSEFAPRLAGWQARFGADQARSLAGFERDWMRYQADLENARFMEQMRFQLMNQPPPPTSMMTGGM